MRDEEVWEVHSYNAIPFARYNTVSCCPTKEWSKGGFAPEKAFLADAAKVSGVTAIETQTMTSEELYGIQPRPEQNKLKVKYIYTPPNSKIKFNHVSR